MEVVDEASHMEVADDSKLFFRKSEFTLTLSLSQLYFICRYATLLYCFDYMLGNNINGPFECEVHAIPTL